MTLQTIKKAGLKKYLICFLMMTVLAVNVVMISGCSSGGSDATSGTTVDIEDNDVVSEQTGIIYVDADNGSGTQDGLAWSTAYAKLEDALTAAASGAEIWVAEGTYYPTTGSDRDESFELVAGVTLYGGFAGTESDSEDRNYETHETILSGDIGTVDDASDNAYHVVIGSDDATIDGFTIQDGNADLANDGSGSLVETTLNDPEILRIVTDVKSVSGGGMLNVHAATIVKNCTFKNNSAGKGGAVYNMVTKIWTPGGETEIGESPYFENCIFEGNSAGGRGGAVNSDFFTTPTYVDCQFINNNCDSKGGAVYNDMGCPSYFINVLFKGNTAERGAAVVADGSSSHRMVYCTFVDNIASDLGAALYQGTYMNDGQTGQAFGGNEVHLYNSLLIGNSSGSSSNSISNWHDDSVIYDADSVIETVDGSLSVEDYLDTTTSISNNATYGWQQDRVTDVDTWVATFDADENSSFIEYSYDTSYASGSATTIFVDVDATGSNDGTSWASAFTDLQDALSAAAQDSEIRVAEGTYKPTDGTDRDATFVMITDVGIYGGYDASTGNCDPVANETILSGDIGVTDDATDNSYHVLVGATGGTIDGFTIKSGYADGLWANSRGGGMLCNDETSPTINDCIFTDNYAIEGGAVSAYSYSAPVITNCTISSNTAERAAGILFRTGPDTQATGASVSDTTFSNNDANDRGGAVYIDYGAWPGFTGCTFDTNTSVGNGGAVYVDNNSSQLDSIETWFDTCVLENNASEKRGGAFAIYEGEVHLSSSTITNNTAGTGGGGIALDYHGSYDTDSTTISGNSSITGDDDIDDDSSSLMGP